MLDTAHLEPLEDLAYRRLLDLYYSSETPIPAETESVSRRLRLGSELVSKVLAEFFTLENGAWKHARCDAEIAEYQAKAGRARENGKAGGRPKIKEQNPAGFKSVPRNNRIETGSKANQNQNQNQEPIVNKAKGSLDELKDYAVEIGALADDGEFMFHNWESNGWKNGSSPVRCWRAGLRKYKSAGWLPSQKVQTGGLRAPRKAEATLDDWQASAQRLAEENDRLDKLEAERRAHD